MNNQYIVNYNDIGLYESGDSRKNSIKLNLSLTFEKDKTERYKIGSSTNALIDLRYGADGYDGYKFLADDGTYKEIPTGGDVEVIKLSEWFNESPSVLIEQTWIFLEENAKLFKALEDNKTIILALYNGSGFNSPYDSLKKVYGKLSINHISATKIEISVEDWSIYSNRNTIQMYSLKFGPFDKSETNTYIVNAIS